MSNNALSRLRKQTSERQGMPGKKARGVSEVLDESALAPSELVSSAEHEARLMECLEEMPSALREVIVLRDFEQLPWTTISERTSSANSTVRARYRDAWTRLSRRMNAQGDPGEASP